MFFLCWNFLKDMENIFFTLRSSYRIYKRFLEFEVAVETLAYGLTLPHTELIYPTHQHVYLGKLIETQEIFSTS